MKCQLIHQIQMKHSGAEGDSDDGDVNLAKCDSSDEGFSAASDGEEADGSGSDTDNDIANLELLSFCGEKRTQRGRIVKPTYRDSNYLF